jgi:hypothetical protein
MCEGGVFEGGSRVFILTRIALITLIFGTQARISLGSVSWVGLGFFYMFKYLSDGACVIGQSASITRARRSGY